MNNEVNHINDWFVYQQSYDNVEIVGLFRNTSIFEILLKLDESSYQYIFLTADELIEKGKKLNPHSKKKKVTLNVSLTEDIKDTCIANSILKEYGVIIKNKHKYSINKNKIEEILKQNV